MRVRDRLVASVLGAFFIALAIPVGLGTGFAQLAIDRAINIAAATILGAVGVVLLVWGRRGAGSS